MSAQLHLAENALALHLLLQRLEGLVDVVVPDENLHAAYLSLNSIACSNVNVREPADAPIERHRTGSIGRGM